MLLFRVCIGCYVVASANQKGTTLDTVVINFIVTYYKQD